MPKRNWGLGEMDLADLVDLRDRVEQALHDKIASEQSALKARIEELASYQGARNGAASMMNGGDTTPRARGRRHSLKGRKVAPKYRGPQGETWSGRGLAPRWLSELERKGKKRESFLIAP